MISTLPALIDDIASVMDDVVVPIVLPAASPAGRWRRRTISPGPGHDDH